ncbi:hypothetical protein, conserved [Leishmania tarentolae]|uniref:Cullin neddylation domain-containing protein n=1 Tax=Leishmania tarentolae TaxID=5689 RepID=A0A640KVB9_LEITA|nr:hypothetical protein, conserved [Leishmania tarentolae]
MTVSLHDLIKEWEAVNAELYRASQESHQRYPFPSHRHCSSYGRDCCAESLSSSCSPLSSTTTYARVYNLLSRVRHIAEDARYNSFCIIQHLLWVTIVAWANQMANASGDLIQLPIEMRRYYGPSPRCPTRRGSANSDSVNDDTAGKAGLSAPIPVQRTSFPCPLLPPLEFWDPSVLEEMAGASSPEPDTARDASLHRAPNLPEVWSNAVQRIFALWCATSMASSSAEAAQSHLPQNSCSTASPGTLEYAYTWIIVAQHYHRFKSLLSLFFLRYDVMLEDAEEVLRRRGRQQLRQQKDNRLSDPHNEEVQRAAAHSPRPPSFLLRLHGESSLVSSFSPTPGGATSASGADNRMNNSSTPDTLPAERESTKHITQARASTHSPSSLPSTANLLGHLMRTIVNENLAKVREVTGGVLLFLLLPRIHSARLRKQITAPASGIENPGKVSHCAPSQGNTATDEADTGKDVALALASIRQLSSVSTWHSDEQDGDDDDDCVVWSSPPSPLLSCTAASFGHDNGDAPAQANMASASTTDSQVRGRAEQEEYVARKVFKLLLMLEDCHIHILQRWLIENGKRVSFFYGAQLATNLFDNVEGQQADFSHHLSSFDPSIATVSTTRTLADANRVLRETLQAYVRLRAKLLFLNAGTTHFLDALTPWGRTHMLESLNAFLCGFCGVRLPPSSFPSAGDVPDKRTTESSKKQPNKAAALLLDGCNESALFFPPTNVVVTDFARRWGVPLWIAMCNEARQRMEALKLVEQKRAKQEKGTKARTENECSHVTQPEKYPQQQHAIERLSDEAMGGKDHGCDYLRSTGRSTAPVTCSFAAADVSAVDDSCSEKPDTRDRHSVASTELEDAVSRTTSIVWPPRSPTVANEVEDGRDTRGIHRHGGAEEGSRAITRRRGRGLDLKRVLHQQQQRRARLGNVKLPQQGVTASRVGTQLTISEDGGDVVESLYTAETTSVGDNAGRLRDNTGSAATEERQHGGEHLTTPGDSHAKGFSRSAQLHQVATLPDEGFPCLLYLMPRRSRFPILDKAATAVQQQLLTLFSANVQNYLTDYLVECETAAEAAVAADQRIVLASQKKKREKASQVTAMGGQASTGTAAASSIAVVTPFPKPVLVHMVFLLEMTYAALQGRDDPTNETRDNHTEDYHTTGNGGSRRPLIETGLTATGQEVGAAVLEQCNGEFESVTSTKLSAPTSPALLAIAAVRKGFQGFLISLEKRAVLTLAQALYVLVQQGAAQQPPAAQLDAVDIILNMASLLNSKDMFVMLVKGYLAPQVMMCRSKSEIVVESQVVDRMAYRLGAAVTAPCITLLRDLRLAMSNPWKTTRLPPPSDTRADLAEDWELNATHGGLSRECEKVNGGEFEGASSGDIVSLCTQPAATRNPEMLDDMRPLQHDSFGLIHRLRVLCQAWWQPHTAVLLSSQRLRQLWEQHKLLDERLVDAVLSVEWQYDGHSEPFRGYGQKFRPWECENSSHLHPLSHSSGGPGAKSQRSSVSDASQGHHWWQGDGSQNSESLSAETQVRTVTAAAVVRGFSSALGNAVRRTGRQAGDFGYDDSENESEDYREAYGGLLTLSTLQQYRSMYGPSTSSHRGSNFSSAGSPGAVSGPVASREWRGTSDGAQSTAADGHVSTTVPVGGRLERRHLRWPLGSGQLAFYMFSKGAVSAGRSVSQAVQIFGPPLTFLVCQLLDRASEQPYTFDALHKALPVQAPKPLLAHILHELVKADVVIRSVAPGSRQLTYQLRDDTCEVRQRKVIVDVRAAAQQQWVTKAMTMTDAEAFDNGEGDSPERSGARNEASTANPTAVTTVLSTSSLKPVREARLDAPGKAKSVLRVSVGEPSSPTYSANCAHKIKVCIVRIMKAERVLPHRELLERVALALEGQFMVTPSQFKGCVAHLIEKEFLQRGEQGEYMLVP